jgi:hypothetical protein
LVKKIIEEIESGRFDVNKYINEEKRKELIESTNLEKVTEIIYNYMKENYKIDLENQKFAKNNANS